MKKLLRVVAAWFVVTTCNAPPPNESIVQPSRSPLHTHRVPLDAHRDALRHPNLFLDFAGLAPGHQVLELGGGDGYTSMHMAQRVGPSGSVLAVNPPQWSAFMRPYIAARLHHGPVPGVTFTERPFDDPVPSGHDPLDLVVCVLIYHDILYIDVDRSQMNQRLFAALKPVGDSWSSTMPLSTRQTSRAVRLCTASVGKAWSTRSRRSASSSSTSPMSCACPTTLEQDWRGRTHNRVQIDSRCCSRSRRSDIGVRRVPLRHSVATRHLSACDPPHVIRGNPATTEADLGAAPVLARGSKGRRA